MVKTQTPTKRKHTPTRSCVICRAKQDKRSLTRLVTTGAGVVVDPTGKMNGRGAYLCDDRECWERAVKTDTLERALRTTLTDADRRCLQQAQPAS